VNTVILVLKKNIGIKLQRIANLAISDHPLINKKINVSAILKILSRRLIHVSPVRLQKYLIRPLNIAKAALN
jgi:hypothetical protein